MTKNFDKLVEEMLCIKESCGWYEVLRRYIYFLYNSESLNIGKGRELLISYFETMDSYEGHSGYRTHFFEFSVNGTPKNGIIYLLLYGNTITLQIPQKKPIIITPSFNFIFFCSNYASFNEFKEKFLSDVCKKISNDILFALFILRNIIQFIPIGNHKWLNGYL